MTEKKTFLASESRNITQNINHKGSSDDVKVLVGLLAV
jgi:hypothetical protein